MKRILAHSAFRYLLVGSTAAATEFGSFWLLNRGLHRGLFVSNSISFMAALCVSFILNRMWAFRAIEGHQHSKRTQAVLYVTLAVINLGLSNVVVYSLTQFVGVAALASKIVAMALIAAWNYLLFSRLIFRKMSTQSQSADPTEMP